jgi:hypothetical protein
MAHAERFLPNDQGRRVAGILDVEELVAIRACNTATASRHDAIPLAAALNEIEDPPEGDRQ